VPALSCYSSFRIPFFERDASAIKLSPILEVYPKNLIRGKFERPDKSPLGLFLENFRGFCKPSETSLDQTLLPSSFDPPTSTAKFKVLPNFPDRFTQPVQRNFCGVFNTTNQDPHVLHLPTTEFNLRPRLDEDVNPMPPIFSWRHGVCFSPFPSRVPDYAAPSAPERTVSGPRPDSGPLPSGSITRLD